MKELRRLIAAFVIAFGALVAVGPGAKAAPIGGLAAAPVQASAGTGVDRAQYYYRRGPARRYHRRYYRRHYYRPYYGGGYYRPSRVVCSTRYRTVWNGYRWVNRPTRVCRRVYY